MFPLNICSHVVSLVCHDQLVLEKPKEKPIVAGPKPQWPKIHRVRTKVPKQAMLLNIFNVQIEEFGLEISIASSWDTKPMISDIQNWNLVDIGILQILSPELLNLSEACRILTVNRAFQRGGGGGTGGNLPRAPSLRGAPKFAKTKKNNFERFLI